MKFLLILVLGLFSIQTYAKKCADFSTQQQAQKWYEQRKKSGQTTFFQTATSNAS